MCMYLRNDNLFATLGRSYTVNMLISLLCRWFMENAHAPYFSSLRWQRFVKRRAVPGSGVSFAEIEVPLCNIPSKEDWLADLEQERREQEGTLTDQNILYC